MAMKSRQRVIVSDVAHCEALAGTSSLQVLLEAGVRAVQSTPLISSSGNLLGIISTHYPVPTVPAGHQLTLLDLLARQIADFLHWSQPEQSSDRNSIAHRSMVISISRFFN